MSYHAYRVHWKIVEGDNPPIDRYSFHKSGDDVAEFIREVMNQNKDRPDVHYRTEGPGTMQAVKGNVYGKLLANTGPGIWVEPTELGLPLPQ